MTYINCLISGDVNNDEEVNVLDVVQVVNCILDNSCSGCDDINMDGNIDVLDIVSLVNIIIT